MRRHLQVVPLPVFDEQDDPSDDGPTLVEPPSRRPLPALEASTTASAPSDFDDVPTFVGAPPPAEPGPATSEVRVGARRLWSVDKADAARFRDEVTRIEVPLTPVPSAPHPSTLEPTVPGLARLRGLQLRAHLRGPLPVRIAMGVVLAFIAAMALVSSARRRAPAVAATQLNAPVSAPVAASVASSPLPVTAVVPPEIPAAVIAPAAPAVALAGVPDEAAAVDAVGSGNLARAAQLYAALAAAHPTNDAYREAARILLEGSKESSR